MDTHDVVYLVQGQRERVEACLPLADRARAEAVFLTYDAPLDGALYLPDSTWAEGRNRLLQAAWDAGPYRCYVFCDDDIVFARGDWQTFENHLLDWEPAVGVPVVPRTAHTRIPLRTQPFGLNDEQLMGVRHDVIADGLLFPYQTWFDLVHWWAACHIHEILVQTFYRDGARQFNRIEIDSACARRYDDPDEGRARFRPLVRRWLDTQLVGTYRDIEYDTGQLHWRAWRRVVATRLRTLGRRRSPDRLARRLAPHSTLREQHDRLSALVPEFTLQIPRGLASPLDRLILDVTSRLCPTVSATFSSRRSPRTRTSRSRPTPATGRTTSAACWPRSRTASWSTSRRESAASRRCRTRGRAR